MIEKTIGEICEESYITYGREVNSNRALPLLYDGLKPSYRRMIWKAIESGNHIKSLDLIGKVAAVHPHGDRSIIGVETNLVRFGILREDGNFGYYPIYGEPMPAAAPRYTETGVTEKWYDLISPFIDLVPRIEGEVTDVWEPSYIPTPIPLSLVFGASGIGIGINTLIPSFSPTSILEAYLKDDPYLLKPGYDLEFDEDLCEFERLWKTGKGRIIYKYHVEYGWSGGNDGVYVWGDTQLFSPDWSLIEEWRSQGLLFIRDETTNGKPKIFIGRNKGVRKISTEDIYNECIKCTSSYYALQEIRTRYRIGIHDNKKAIYIGLRDWIDITYKNYLNLIELYKSTNIEKLNFDIDVYTYLKQVAEILINTEKDITNQQIADQLGISIDIVNAITKKSISTLKRTDTESKINSIKNKKYEYDSIKPKEFVKSIVLKM
jgi:hypothetical protein